jgi:hypothetical protein
VKVRIPVLVTSDGNWLSVQVGEGYCGVSRPNSPELEGFLADERKSISGDGEAVHTYWIEAEVEVPTAYAEIKVQGTVTA